MNNTLIEKTTTLNNISLPELIACLKLYYQGQLNDVAYDLLPRLHLNLNQLDPTNSLFGQVTSEDLEYCLSLIDRQFTDALKFFITSRPHLLTTLESDYVKIDTTYTLDQFILTRVSSCIYRLTDLLHQILD